MRAFLAAIGACVIFGFDAKKLDFLRWEAISGIRRNEGRTALLLNRNRIIILAIDADFQVSNRLLLATIADTGWNAQQQTFSVIVRRMTLVEL